MRSIVTISSWILATTALAHAEGGAPVVANPALAFGDWGERVELALPPAAHDARPHIAIVESHHALDTEVGSGWRLDAGASVIRRRSPTNGVPDQTSDLAKSTFYVDGTKLVTVTNPGVAHYEPETYDSSRFDYNLSANTWTRQREGWTWTYARTRDVDESATPPSCTAPCNTEAWLLSAAVDPYGNRIDYTYSVVANPEPIHTMFPNYGSHEILLDKITYAASKVVVSFTYETRPDFRIDWTGGFPIFKNRRLTAVAAKIGTSVFSQYALQYADQGSGSTLAAPLSWVGALTDCDNVAVAKDAAPAQSLLRKVHRVGAASTDPHFVARCNAYYKATASAIGWANAIRIDDLYANDGPITQPTGPIVHMGALENPVSPIAADLDGDGRSDLVMIVTSSNTNIVFPHAVYIATPNLAQPFVGATGGGPNAALASTWQEHLQDTLLPLHFTSRHAHSLVDIDRDGRPELVYENDDGVGNGIVDKYDPFVFGGFTSLTTELDGCDVRYGTFADIDGDGYVDLVVRPHVDDAGACPDATTTTWIKNRGAAPWLDSADRASLAVPLEQATLPAEWNNALDQCETLTGSRTVQGPTDIDPGWGTAAVYLGDQMQLADFNGDGIADYAIAAYACWTTSSSRWADAGPNTIYSRIWYGTGHGTFVDASIWAGPPTLLDTKDTYPSPTSAKTRIVTGTLGTADLDRDGHAELLAASLGTTPFGLAAFSSKSIATGFGVGRSPTSAGLRVVDTVQTAWDCDAHSIAPAIGDFDGDGFVDVITIEVNDVGADGIGSSVCGTDYWCVTLRKSNRDIAEGRLVITDNEHGGRDRLTWGFSAQLPNKNPELATNLEVLQAVSGPGGTRQLTYQNGLQLVDRFAGFAEVTATNNRGGVETYSFVQAPYALGAQALGVRYRENGSIEHASVFIHGQYSDGIVVNTSPPYFDPVIRTCEYDVGTALLDLDSIEAGCLGLAWKLTNVPNSDGQSVAITAANYQLAIGHDRYASGRVAAYNKIWGGSARAPVQMTAAPDAVSAQLAAIKSNVVPVANKFGAWSRWPIPSQLAGAVPDIDALQSGGLVLYFGSPVTYASDSGYDAAVRKEFARYEHRDLATDADDREIDFLQQKLSTQGYWYRAIQEVVRDDGHAMLAITNRTFSGFDDPTMVMRCGTDLTACTTDHFAYGTNGTLTTHTLPDTTVESWTRLAWCGEPLTYKDPALRVTTDTRDGRCLVSRELRSGATTTYTYDGLLRVKKRVVDAGGGTGNVIANTYYYDDDYSYQESFGAREDVAYTEPRRAVRRGDGELEFVHLDGLGRETKRYRCLDSHGDTTGGAISLVACNPLTVRTFVWNLYGADGLLAVSTEPLEPGTTPVTTGFGHDGQNRVTGVARPDHVVGGPAWLVDTIAYGAGRTSVTSPTDTGATTRVVTRTTLRESATVDGVERSVTTFDRLGLPILVTGPGGVSFLRLYDSQHRLASEVRTDEDGYVQLLPSVVANGSTQMRSSVHAIVSRDARGRILEETLPDSTYLGTTAVDAQTLDYTYDAIDRPLTRSINSVVVDRVSYTDPTKTTLGVRTETSESGAVSTVSSDGLGRAWIATAPQVSDRYVYDTAGRVVSKTDGNNLATTYGYDTWDRIATVSDPRTATTTYQRDTAGRLVSVTDGDGVVDSFTYTYSGELYEHHRGPYLVDQRSYDTRGRVSREVDDGVLKLMTYDGLDRLLSVREGVTAAMQLKSTTFEYDDADRVTSVGRWPVAGFATAVTSFDYDAWGRATDIADPLGHTTHQAFDVAGRIRRVTDPLGGVLDTAYDDHGRVASRDRPGAGTEYFTYRPNQTYNGIAGLWRIDRADDQDVADALATETFVDASGNRIAELTAMPTNGGARMDGATREWTYSYGRPLEADLRAIDGSLYSSTRYAYGSNGRVISTATGPRVDAYEYTAAGRLKSIFTPDDYLRRTYANGLLATETEAGVTRTLTRDTTYGWVIGESRVAIGAARTLEIGRDPLGRAIRLGWGDGTNPQTTQTFDLYDYYDHPWLQTNSVGSTNVNESWTYDIEGRPLTRLTNGTGLSGAQTTWSWYDNGVLASVTTPSGRTLSYDYGSTSAFDYQLDKVKVGTTAIATVNARDLRGAITQLTVPGRSRTTSYDRLGRVAQETSMSSSVLAFQRSAAYLPDDRLASETLQSATGAPWTNSYAYDGAGRLVGETSGRTPTAYTYILDTAGNRQQTLVGGAPGMTATYDGPKLTAVDGTALAYDAWNAVSADHHGNHYLRSADGELAVLGTNLTSATAFARNASGVPIAAVEPGGITRRTTWGLSAATLPLEVDQGDGTVLDYVVVDGQHVGTLTNGVFTAVETDPRNTTLAQGTQTLDFADGSGLGTTAPTGTNERFLFASLETVPTASEVMLARRRTYDPTTARFLERDPIGSRGGFELYQYGNGDPINFVDPMGTTATGSACGGTSSGVQLNNKLPPVIIDTKGSGINTSFEDAMVAAFGLSQYMKSLQQQWSGLHIPNPTTPYPDFPGGPGGMCVVNCETGNPSDPWEQTQPDPQTTVLDHDTVPVTAKAGGRGVLGWLKNAWESVKDAVRGGSSDDIEFDQDLVDAYVRSQTRVPEEPRFDEGLVGAYVRQQAQISGQQREKPLEPQSLVPPYIPPTPLVNLIGILLQRAEPSAPHAVAATKSILMVWGDAGALLGLAGGARAVGGAIGRAIPPSFTPLESGPLPSSVVIDPPAIVAPASSAPEMVAPETVAPATVAPDTVAPEPAAWKGPTDYSSLKPPKNVAASTKPTARQVADMKAANRAHNDGVLRSDLDGEVLVDSGKSKSGVTPPPNSAEIDHIKPVDKGGTRDFENLQILGKKQNREKWNH